jgi:hypothetical protein
MALDGGLVVGYLTAAALGAGKRWADRRLDSRLDQLTDRVARRIGRGPVDRLSRDPRDENVRRELGLMIDGKINRDRAFERELSGLVDELDRRGGRQLVNQVYAQYNLQAFDHGVVIGRDFNYFHAPDPNDLSGAPGWVKFVIALGTAVAVAGMFIFGYTLFTDMPDIGDPDFGDVPPGIPLAFGVFFAGFVLLGIGALGRSFSSRR